jgi:tight adherence protein C
MSELNPATASAAFVAVSAAALMATAAWFLLARMARPQPPGVEPDAALRRRPNPLPRTLRALRVAVAAPAAHLEPQLPSALVAPLDRQLRRAGCAERLSATELLLLGTPALLLAVPVAVFNAGALWLPLLLTVLTPALSLRWVRGAALRRELQVLRELPFHLDMLALALESGATLLLALRSSTPRAPPGPLREALEALALDLQTGRLRADALAGLQRRIDFDSITTLTTAIREADRSGAGLARVLRIQAEQRRHERFYRAEKLAMQAPVRMLGPLVLCIFPCTFIVIGFVLFVRVAGS